MKILELFCGLGGWSKGFHDIFPNAEFYGVDIKDYGYPYNFIKADLNDWESKEKYDIILASPPCTEFSEVKRNTATSHYSERIGLSIGQLIPMFGLFHFKVNWLSTSGYLPP